MTAVPPVVRPPAETAIARSEAPAARRARTRARLWWVVLSIAFVVIGLVLLAIQGATQWANPGRFDPDSHGPDGYRAVVEVLRDQGVDVTVARTSDEAISALAQGGTLAMTDARALADETIERVWAAADTVVLLEPTSRLLDLSLGAEVAQSWAIGPTGPDCDLDAVQRVRTIAPTMTFTGGETGCFPDGDGGFGLITGDHDGTRMVAIDGNGLFTNGTVLTDDNAALGLALLGGDARLVFYKPSATETDLGGGTATLGDLTPGWVTPALTMLALTGLAAAFVAGRRFGPLVAERLPVTVRASETMEGRARLYARGRDAAHAAKILRRDTAGRVGRMLGMGARPQPEAVAEAAAAVLAADRDRIRFVLAGPSPTTDTELVELSDRLIRLEAAVRAAVRTERTHS